MQLALKIYVTAFLCTLAASTLLAQNPYMLHGYMGVEGGESFHYTLELYDSAGGYLSGYSYTFSEEKKAVKAALAARIDRVQKTLQIQEREIIYNHDFHSRATICLVRALLHIDETQNALNGSIITQTIGHGGTCSKGSISFINNMEIDALFSGSRKQEPVAAAVKKSLPGPSESPRKSYDAAPAPKSQPLLPAPAKITEGKEGVYEWFSDEILFRIWDGSNVDNDRVTILFNGQPVLEQYTLNKQAKELVLRLSGNEIDSISVVALNEGNTPPNTANISISDGSIIHEIIAYNKITKTATIRIRKKK